MTDATSVAPSPSQSPIEKGSVPATAMTVCCQSCPPLAFIAVKDALSVASTLMPTKAVDPSPARSAGSTSYGGGLGSGKLAITLPVTLRDAIT